jgi:hypothetical protein
VRGIAAQYAPGCGPQAVKAQRTPGNNSFGSDATDGQHGSHSKTTRCPSTVAGSSSLSVILPLSNDANSCRQAAKNHFLSSRCSRFAQRYFDVAARYSSRDRRPDLTCVLSCGCAWFDWIIRDGTTAACHWMGSECQIGLRRGCVAIARLVQRRTRIPVGSFASSFHRKRGRNDLPLHVDRCWLGAQAAKSCGLRSSKGSRDKGWTASEASQQSQERKQGLFHTLCTSGADASRAERGYPIGVRRCFSVEHCLRMRLRALTACRVTWRNSISAKDLRASDAITAGGSSFCRRSDARLRSVCRGQSRPTKSSGPSLDSARQTDPREHRIGGDARGEVRDERPWADAGLKR